MSCSFVMVYEASIATKCSKIIQTVTFFSKEIEIVTLKFLYKKILVPYDGSKPSQNALQQAIQLVNLSFSSNNTSSKESIQIILLHIVEEINVRIPNLYIGLRIIAGKPLKDFFKEVYEEMRNEALKKLEDTKKRIESSIIVNDKKKMMMSAVLSVNPQVIVGNPAKVIVDIANNKEKVDLIIMGSTGLKGISRIRALGRTSTSVMS
jgi:nucleotide-binding universal stress UspA family protein